MQPCINSKFDETYYNQFKNCIFGHEFYYEDTHKHLEETRKHYSTQSTSCSYQRYYKEEKEYSSLSEEQYKKMKKLDFTWAVFQTEAHILNLNPKKTAYIAAVKKFSGELQEIHTLAISKIKESNRLDKVTNKDLLDYSTFLKTYQSDKIKLEQDEWDHKQALLNRKLNWGY